MLFGDIIEVRETFVCKVLQTIFLGELDVYKLIYNNVLTISAFETEIVYFNINWTNKATF